MERSRRARPEWDLELTPHLMDTARQIVLLLDQEGRIVHYNRFLEELTGWPLEEMRGRSWFESFLPEAEVASVQGVFDQATSGVRTRGHVNPILIRDGEQRVVEWFDDQLEHPELGVLVLAMGHDITELVQAHERLEQSEKRYRVTFEITQDGLWEWHVPSGDMRINARFYTMLGYEPDAFPPRVEPFQALVHPEDVDAVRVAVERAFGGEAEGFHSEFRARTAQGGWRWVLSRADVVERGPGGEPVLMIGVHTDIHPMRIITEQLARQTRVLEEAERQALAASQAKSDFMANMSHELRTPLSGVLGMSALIQDQSRDAEVRDMARSVEECGLRLLEMVESILTFGDPEAALPSPEQEDFDLGQVLTRLVEGLQDRADHLGLELRLDLDPALPVPLRGDPGRLSRIMSHLAGNGLKFTRTGWVEVRASLVERGEDGALVQLEVHDTGPGIPPAELGRVFWPFEQLDGSTSRSHQGAGMGLSVAQRLVGSLGGVLRVESELGQGSRFWFRVGLALPEGPQV